MQRWQPGDTRHFGFTVCGHGGLFASGASCDAAVVLPRALMQRCLIEDFSAAAKTDVTTFYGLDGPGSPSNARPTGTRWRLTRRPGTIRRQVGRAPRNVVLWGFVPPSSGDDATTGARFGRWWSKFCRAYWRNVALCRGSCGQRRCCYQVRRAWWALLHFNFGSALWRSARFRANYQQLR